MSQNKIIWEIAESFLNGKLSQIEKEEIQNRLDNEPGFAIEFEECISLLGSISGSGKQKSFRSLLNNVHKEQTATPIQKVFTQLISLPVTFWKTAAVAATVALLTSTITYWSLTPSIKKNDSQYNTISREVEHIKKGLKNNTDAIETIKKNESVNPSPPTSDVKFTGTGFALTNDGYFVTAWHVINHGNFDSVYILNNRGQYYKASLVIHDDKADLAVLKVDRKNFKFSKTDVPYTIAKAKSPIGARIFTIGYPQDDEVYCEGYVSSKDGFDGDVLQYTLELPAAHGQSGSPVIDANGNIVGILTAVGSRGEANTYAVSTKALIDLIEDMPKANKVHISKSNKLKNIPREKQIDKMEAYTFSVKVYKK